MSNQYETENRLKTQEERSLTEGQRREKQESDLSVPKSYVETGSSEMGRLQNVICEGIKNTEERGGHWGGVH